jgi:hypothetical protein
MKGLTAKLSGFIFVISFVIFGLNSDPYPQALLDSTKAYIRKMPKAVRSFRGPARGGKLIPPKVGRTPKVKWLGTSKTCYLSVNYFSIA